MINRETELRATMKARLADVLPYRGAQVYADFVTLLASIEACYAEQLLTVKPEDLRYKQGAAAQVRILRSILTEPREEIFDLPIV